MYKKQSCEKVWFFVLETFVMPYFRAVVSCHSVQQNWSEIATCLEFNLQVQFSVIYQEQKQLL